MDGVNTRFDFAEPLPSIRALGRVHLIAIGGAGMSAVARLLLARDVVVSGSDAKESSVLEALGAEGADVHVGHDARWVEEVDTVVISSAIREDNVELMRARELGLRVLHRAQALAVTMEGQRRLAVAGANGKTTTTSMLTAALEGAGLHPSFASGGELADRGTNAVWHTGSPFVVEADESDGSFLTYRPDVAVITNVQPDHLDFYGTFDRVRQAYAEFAASTGEGGLIVACADDPGSAALADQVRGDSGEAAGRRVLTYGTAPGADLRIEDITLEGTTSRSVLVDRHGQSRVLTLRTPGQHNVLNAAAAYLAAVEGAGADPDGTLAGLAGFGGARRRFEVVGEAAGVTIVDDYAHNAGKVEAVVGTAADIAHAQGGRLLVIFQPHLFSRTRDFAEGFAAGLAPADRVILLPIYGAREDPIDGVTSELIAAPLRERWVAAGRLMSTDSSLSPGGTGGRGGTDSSSSEPTVVAADQAVALTVAEARPGDLVMTIGAGDVTVLGPRILQALGHR